MTANKSILDDIKKETVESITFGDCNKDNIDIGIFFVLLNKIILKKRGEQI